MVTYSTNYMGPISMDWFRDRGLTEKKTRVVTEDSILLEMGRKVGDVLEYDEITTHYAGGRIDIRGLDESEFYNGWGEYSLPIMHGEDWNALSDWLDDLTTTVLWDYDMLISTFEAEVLNGRKIRWADER